MINPMKLEEAFLEFTNNFQKWMPDGVISINLSVLNELGLLKNEHFDHTSTEDLMHYFHVLETADKVTLFNDKFAIWIVPKMEEDIASTLTFIALLQKEKPHLEIVFCTEGVYNTPRHILKVLQHYLTEVVDTESFISSMDKTKGA